MNPTIQMNSNATAKCRPIATALLVTFMATSIGNGFGNQHRGAHPVKNTHKNKHGRDA